MGYKGKKPTCPTCGHPLAASHAKALGKEDVPEWVKVNGHVTKVSEKAVLFSTFALSGVALDVWVPRSQIDAGGMVKEGDKQLTIKQWFAEKESMRHGD